MTWYDHETGSIWSQPWGRAICGELTGTTLKILPFSLVPWETWKAEHPDTQVLVDESGGLPYSSQGLQDDFVAGVAIGDLARGYPYTSISEEVVINDLLGDIPLVIHTNPQTRSIHIFVRQLPDGTLLTFTGDFETLVDDQTGSIWDPVRGLAIDGELVGQALREIPYISSFDWAWLDFYPHSDFYQ